MKTPWIEFRKWPYEEDALHFEVAASDGDFTAAQEFYLDKRPIAKLGERLQDFPKDPHDEVVFAVGEADDNWAYAIHLRFWVYDPVGHAALTVELTNNGNPPYRRYAHFTIRCEAASLNRLGESLRAWINGDQESIRHELMPAAV